MAGSEKTPFEPPESPDIVRWIRWLHHHFTGEGEVIKHAPVVFVVSVIIIAFILSYVDRRIIKNEYDVQISDLEAAINTQRATIENLKNRLAERSAKVTMPPGQAPRHLSFQQRAEIRADLRLNAHKSHLFQINTVPSCDECEQYAEELRDFFNTIPGLQAIGGSLIFPAAHYPRGIQFITDGKEPEQSAAMRVLDALRDAGINPALTTETGMKQGDFAILIGRQNRS